MDPGDTRGRLRRMSMAQESAQGTGLRAEPRKLTQESALKYRPRKAA